MKPSIRVVLLACSAIALCSSPVVANPVVDQSQYTFDTGLAPSHTGGYLGQSFTAGLGGLLTNISIASNGSTDSDGTLSVDIFAGNGLGGTNLGTVALTYPGNTAYDYSLNLYVIDLDVSSLGLNLTSGNQYTFMISNITGNLLDRGLLMNDRNPYAGGNEYAGGTWATFVSGYDLVFNTKVEQSVPDSGSTLAMLGLGLAAMVVGVRSNRRGR